MIWKKRPTETDVAVLNSNITITNEQVSFRPYFVFKGSGSGTTVTVTFESLGENTTVICFGRFGYTSTKMSMAVFAFDSSNAFVKSFGDETLSATRSGNTITVTCASSYAKMTFISNVKMT